MLTPADTLLYTTVKISSSVNNTLTGTGTGFFMRFPEEGDTSIIALITNKHVVAGATELTAVCHLAEEGMPSGRFMPFTLPNNERFVVHHPSADVDLCAILYGPVLNHALQAGTPLFFSCVEPDLIPAEDDWQYFDAIEEVTMIGCPNGISDEVNNFPIVRRGVTASSLARRYNGKSEFMVDMACFPGSSGSPVFIYDRHGYFDRRNNSYQLGSTRIRFVGVLYAGPLVTNNGQLILGTAPRIAVQAMMHLGNVIRSTAVLELGNAILRHIANLR